MNRLVFSVLVGVLSLMAGAVSVERDTERVPSWLRPGPTLLIDDEVASCGLPPDEKLSRGWPFVVVASADEDQCSMYSARIFERLYVVGAAANLLLGSAVGWIGYTIKKGAKQ